MSATWLWFLVQSEETDSITLQATAKALPRLDEDDRILPILEHLSLGFTAGISSEYAVSTNKLGEAITAEMIAPLSETSFPFCMRSMQDTLKSSKHLKHEGRQQYNLFLKVRLSREPCRSRERDGGSGACR